MDKQLADIVTKLKEVEKAMLAVVEMWGQASPEVQDILAEGFPFNKSFDEIHADVLSWVETLENKIKKA